MTSELPPEVRLVRCPKCRKVLTELADVPLYRCGGCGTVLQAKNRKRSVKNTVAGSEDTDPVHVNILEHASEDKEFSISNQKVIILPTEEGALDQDKVSNQNASEDCNREQPAGVNFCNDVSSSTELTRDENDESSPVAGAKSEEDENKEGGPNFKSSTADNLSATWGTSSIITAECLINENISSETPLSQNSEQLAQSQKSVHHGSDRARSPDTLASTELINPNAELSIRSPDTLESTELINPSSELSMRSLDTLESTELINPSSELSGTLGDLSTVWGTRSIITAECLVKENISLDTPLSHYNEQLDQSQKSILHDSDRVRSPDTLETPELINPSSELSGTLGDLDKSPTTRSSHAYDGSVSSYDGTDDQVLDQHLHQYKRTCTAADFVGNEDRLKRENLPVNMMRRSSSEMQHQARSSLSISFKEKHLSKWDSERHGHPVRNRMRLERDEFPSRLPFNLRGSQAGYGNGSPSSHGHDQFQCSSSFQSADKPEYLEQEKIKLLRMVFELQDQLNRTRIADGRVPTGVAWKEKQIPAYYNHEAPQEEFWHDLNHPRRYWQGKNWSKQCRLSQVSLSGEPTNSRLQASHVCAHSCPQDWQASVQLHPPTYCCNDGLCRAHPGHNCYYPYSSNPSSPLLYVDSEFSSLGHYTKSDDQRHKDHVVKKHYLREKHHTVKQHFRPIACGAPFITCYCCLKLLQLPADFLLFKRRCHRLRCGACSEVLKFSLQNGGHIVPYTSSAADPPPSEVDDNCDAIDRRNLASASHTNDCQHADPVSCSDDYGLSFCKSYSTEGEPVSHVEKLSSEIEEQRPATGPPLHRLMGYSSASDLLYGSNMATSSYYPDKNLRLK